MKTSHLVAGACVMAILIAGCGGGEDTPAASSPEPTPEETTAAETPEGPPPTLCDLVSPEELAAALQIEGTLEPTGTSAGSVQLPSTDLCRFEVSGAATYSQVTLGTSVLPLTADDLTAARASQPYSDYADAPQLGDAGYFDERTGRAVFLVGERGVVIRAQLESTPTLDQVTAAAALVTPLVADVPEAPAEVPEAECDPYAEAAEAVLGEPAEVRRDSVGDTAVNCGFATRTASLGVFVSTDPQSVQDFDLAFEGIPGVEQVDAGQRAQYVDGQGAVLIDDTTTATFLLEPVPAGITPEITALMQALGTP